MSEGAMEKSLSDIRDQLDRADVGDAQLVGCIEEALAGLGLTMKVDELLARPAGDALKRQVLACLALPQPKLPMAMPEHDLRPAASSRNALLSWTRRLTFAQALSRKN